MGQSEVSGFIGVYIVTNQKIIIMLSMQGLRVHFTRIILIIKMSYVIVISIS